MDKDTAEALLTHLKQECNLYASQADDMVAQAQEVIRFFIKKLRRDEPYALRTLDHLMQTDDYLELQK